MHFIERTHGTCCIIGSNVCLT